MSDPSPGPDERGATFPLGRGTLALVTALTLSFALLAYLGWRVAVYPTPFTDLGSYFLPKYQHAADRIAAGELPLWNPYEFGGIPFLATLQPAVFYPPIRVAYFLLDGEVAYRTAFFAHIALAGFLSLLLLRSLGASLWPSVLAALWVVQPAWILRVWDHPVYVWGIAWIPLLLLLLRRVVRTGEPGYAAALAVVTAVQFLSGYPPITLASAYLLLLGLPFFVAETGSPRSPRALGRVALALSLAAGIASLLVAAQLVPTIELARTTDRASEAGNFAKPVAALAAAVPLLAEAIGLPQNTAGAAAAEVWSRYGPALLGLAITAVLLQWRRPIVWYGVAAIALAEFLPLEGYKVLPLYGFVRFALEWDFIGPLLLYLLAGLGLDAISNRWPRMLRLAGPITIAIVAATIVWDWQETGARWTRTRIDLAVPPPEEIEEECDLGGNAYRAFWSFGQWRGALLRAGIRSPAGYEQSLLPDRVANLNAAIGYGNGGMGSAREVLAHRAALARTSVLCVIRIGRPVLSVDHEVLRRGRLPVAYRDPAALPRARLAFSSRVAGSPDEALSLVLTEPPHVVILEGDPPDLAPCSDAGSGTTRIIRDDPERVEVAVDTPCEAHLVLSDTFLDGWTATLDGQPTIIRRADYAFRAVRVPAGRHEVVFRYAPTAVPLGIALSLLGVVLAVCMALVPVFFPRAWPPSHPRDPA